MAQEPLWEPLYLRHWPQISLHQGFHRVPQMHFFAFAAASTVTWKFGPMMKVMDSASGLGANHSHSRSYGADLQPRHEAEAALSCGEIFGSLY